MKKRTLLGGQLVAVDDETGDLYVKQDGLDASLAPLARESGGNLATCATELAAIDALLDLIKTATARIPADPAREGGHLATVVKDHTAGARTPAFVSRLTEVDATPVSLATQSTPYVRAWVQAMKPAGGSGSPGGAGLPEANVGNVFLSAKGETAYWTLVPGSSVELPPCGDLYDFDLTTATGGDGVVVMYET